MGDNNRAPHTLSNVIIDMLKSSGTVGVLTAATVQWFSAGVVFDPFNLALYLVYIVLIISLIYFVVRILPSTLRVIFTWAVTVALSLMSMSWCLNNETVCRTYFVYTDEKAHFVMDTIKDTAVRILNISTHDIK